MTSTEGNTMFTLAVYAVITTGLLVWLGVRWAVDRWVMAGEKVERLADLTQPTFGEHAAQALSNVCKACGPDDTLTPCTCTSQCTATGCNGGTHTSLALFSTTDLEFLRNVERIGLPARRPWRRGRKTVKR